MLDGAPPLHLHHAPLDAAVADVAEVLGVPLDALGHRVGGGGREAALALLKVLVVPDLEGGKERKRGLRRRFQTASKS